MSEPVAAVVVHWADSERTASCVRSILDAGIQVIVVDNASTYGDALPATEVIRPGTNLGYGGAANLGLRRAFELAPIAVLLNDDVTLQDPSGLAALVLRLERDPSTGIAGPLVEGPDGDPQPTIERWPSFWRTLGLALRRRSRPSMLREQHVEAVTGVCLAISRAAFEAVGGFDERYFLYGEEVDLCRRAALAGYRTVFVPAPSIVHHHVAGEVRGDATLHIRINHVRFCREHRGFPSALGVAILFLTTALVRGQSPMALARGIARVLVPERGQFADGIAVPALLAIWVVLLALGSAYNEGLRELGSAGKYAVPFVLIALEAPRIWAHPRSYLHELRPGALHAAAGSLLAFGALSTAWSVLPRHTLTYTAGLGLVFAALLLGPWRIAQSRAGAAALARGVLLGTAAVVLGNVLALVIAPHSAIYQPNHAERRLRGFFENPDELGGYVVVAALALWWFVERSRTLRKLSRTRWRRVEPVAAAAALLYVAELVFSESRTGIVLLAVSLIIFAAGYFGGAPGVLVSAGISFACVGAVIAVLSSPGVEQSLPSVIRPTTLPTFGERTEAWSASIRLIDQRPLGGFGLGTESEMSSVYRADGERLFFECTEMPPALASALPPGGCSKLVPRSRALADFSGDNSHNSFLGLGVQLGACVLGAVVVALLAALVRLGLTIRRAAAFQLAILVGLIAGTGWALLETYLFSPGNAVGAVFWLLLVIGLARGARQEAAT